jgi:hypothetical protein
LVRKRRAYHSAVVYRSMHCVVLLVLLQQPLDEPLNEEDSERNEQ